MINDTVCFFKALADATRLQVVLLLTIQDELCVCELTTRLQLSQPKISRHLALLRSADILVDERRGQWVYYRLHPALPNWCRKVIEAAAESQQPWLTEQRQNQAEAACCD